MHYLHQYSTPLRFSNLFYYLYQCPSISSVVAVTAAIFSVSVVNQKVFSRFCLWVCINNIGKWVRINGVQNSMWRNSDETSLLCSYLIWSPHHFRSGETCPPLTDEDYEPLRQVGAWGNCKMQLLQKYR